MSQLSKMRQSRDQWKSKAKTRGQGQRDRRKADARLQARYDQVSETLQATQARVRQLEAQLQGLVTRPKVEVVHLALQLFLEARISFRAVSRVLTLLAGALGMAKAPCPQTIIHWVIRLASVRMDSARTCLGLPLEAAPFTNSLIWIIDISIGLGCGKILTVLALDAHHHQLASGAPTLHHVRCIGVAVAVSWNGDTIADFLKRLIAVMGRPAAYLKDGGSDLHRAAAVLAEQGMGSPCIDDISHAAACMLNPHRDEATIARQIRAASPIAQPNRLIVGHADRLLGRDGRMLRALDEMGPGSMMVEGRPFRVELD